MVFIHLLDVWACQQISYINSENNSEIEEMIQEITNCLDPQFNIFSEILKAEKNVKKVEKI
jgi:hypothetical protein